MASSLWGTETSAGQMIWQSFDRRQKIEVLLAHGDNSTLQRLSIESKMKMQMHHVEKVYLVKN